MPTIDETYSARFPTSALMSEKAKDYFPSGIVHQNRYATPFQVYFDRANGGIKFDLDGHETVDYVGGNGALLQGHAHPEITETISFIGLLPSFLKIQYPTLNIFFSLSIAIKK